MTQTLPDDMPFHLWKYTPPPLGANKTDYSKENLENLILRNTIRMTGVTEVNDPFDCFPVIVEDMTNEQIFADAERLITTPSTNPRVEIRRQNIQKRYPTKRIRRQKRGQIIREYRPLALQSSEKFFRESGFYSLSETPRNPAMWAHYAANRTGFCIGFNTCGPPEGFAACPAIKYQKERPKTHLSLHNSEISADIIKLDLELENAFLTKSIDWVYEKERRYITELGCEGYKTDDMITIKPLKIGFILFGAKTSDDNKAYIKDLIAKSSHDKVKFLQAQLCKTTFKIKFFKAA